MNYQGDITEHGNLVPFSVGVRDNIHPDAVKKLNGAPQVQVVEDPTIMQALLIRSATKLLTQESFHAYPALMHVARAGVGMDNINIELAAQHGIATINTPGASSAAVAKRALTFILDWSAKIAGSTQLLRERQWLKGDSRVDPVDTGSLTLGIVGYGRIGRTLERYASSLELFGKIQFSDVANIPDKVDLDALIQNSDVISLHVSGEDEVLSPARIRCLKPGALVVNTARGGVVNITALLEAMNERGIHYATDVYANEGKPMFDDDAVNKLIAHPNFTGTHHTAASDKGTQRALGLEAATRTVEYALDGTVNAPGIGGQTLGTVMPASPNADIVRTVLLHQTSLDPRGEMTHFLKGAGAKNVFAGETVRGPLLACTIVDMEAHDPKTSALRSREAIGRMSGVHKHRILLLTEKAELGEMHAPGA